MSNRDREPAQHVLDLLDRIENLERAVSEESIKRERVETFMRERIMDLEKKLIDVQSALLICQKAVRIILSDQAPEQKPPLDKPPDTLKVICG